MTLVPLVPNLRYVAVCSQVDIRVSEDEPTYPGTTDASLVTSGLIPKAAGDEGDPRTEEEGGCGTRGCTLINVKACAQFGEHWLLCAPRRLDLAA